MEENMEDQQQEDVLSVFDVTMSPSVIYSLKETCRWARLLVYISGGAIAAGLLLIFFNWSDFSRSFYSTNSTMSYVLWGVALLICIIYLTFLVLLFVFSIKVKTGLDEKDITRVEHGIASLKVYFILSTLLSGYFIISFLFSFYRIIVN